MIRLDAATVLLQWSVGGLGFLWVTGRGRQVGVGYGWLLRGVYGLVATGALAVGLTPGPVPVREVATGIAVPTTGSFASRATARVVASHRSMMPTAFLIPMPGPAAAGDFPLCRGTGHAMYRMTRLAPIGGGGGYIYIYIYPAAFGPSLSR